MIIIIICFTYYYHYYYAKDYSDIWNSRFHSSFFSSSISYISLFNIGYCITWSDSTNTSITRWCYQPFWTKAADMPTPRTEVSATSLGDVIYVIGGFDAYGHPTDIVEIYSVMNNTWKRTAAAPLPNPLHHTAATSFNGKVYVVGGFLDSQWTPSNRLFIYDPLKNQWHEG
jgi:hypothetical protein